MRIMVYGAGALGSLVAARLSAAHPVTLVGRADHVAAIRESGLRVTGRTECVARSIRAVTELSGEAPDVVLVTVKANDTERAMASLEPYRGASLFVSLQNGLGNEETMAACADRVLGAVINQGVTFLEPGAVFHAGEGETAFGAFQGTTLEDAERIANAFNGAGLRAVAVTAIRERIWSKVVLNAAVNPLTALLGKRTGELVGDAELEAAMADIVAESVAIAAADGIELRASDILATIRAVAEATRDNKSSMLQDLERGRPTEIRQINGALVERARAHGMAAPRNELLTRLVASRERAASTNR